MAATKKILIICAGLQLGGAEKVAADIGLYAPQKEFTFHYLTFKGFDNDYGAQIEQNGGTVFTWPSPACGYGQYLRRLDRLMKEQHYSAVHSHTMFSSGFPLLAAKWNRVPVRIAHSHTTKTETPVSVRQKIYERLMRQIIRFSATDFFACGVAAGEWLFGKKLFSRKGVVIQNGIDTARFAFSPSHRAQVRRELGIGENAFVIGHSGTLIPLKNQSFLISLMPRICKVIPEATLVLLGRGDEKNRAVLQKAIADSGVADHIILYGATRRVDEFLSAFDVFTLPSLREGTPLALLEAQANGLPCIVSDRIPNDAFVTELVQPLPLEKEPWVEAICSASRREPSGYATALRQQSFDVNRAYQPVYEAYRRRQALPCGIVALSFDDGRKDNFDIAQQLLKPLHLPAAFNITTGYVDGSCPEALRPSPAPAMCMADVKALAAEPLFELALHGDQHQNTAEDIARGRGKLLHWLALPPTQRFGFASPGSGLDLSDAEALRQEPFRSGVSYVRSSLRCRTWAPIRILARKAGRVIHSPLLYRIAYRDTLMEPGSGHILYSVPIMGDISAKQVMALVTLCAKKKQALILMLHSIEDTPRDTWSWSRQKFEALCRYLAAQREAGRLDVKTVQELYELIR